MAIKVQCSSCDKRFQAKDQLAGKKVKCPGCGEPIRIPSGKPARAAATATATAAASKKPEPVDPLTDLLNEIGVSSVAPTTGPVCPGCQASIDANDVLCVQCGFDLQTGQRIESVSYSEVDEMEGLSETEKLLYKAEKEIDETPVTADDVDFGDGAGSYLVAAVVIVATIVIVAITMGMTIGLRYFDDAFGTATTAMLSVGILFSIGFVWIAVTAFLDDPKMGVCCVFVPFFVAYYAINQRNFLPFLMLIPGYLFCMVVILLWLLGVNVLASPDS